MSKYLTLQMQLMDRDCLTAALKSIGFGTVEVGTGLHLYGYQGDKRKETADLVVRRQFISGSSNDLGFKKTAKGYEMIISEYDAGMLNRRAGGNFQEKLQRSYTEHAIKKLTAQVRGTVMRTPNGKRGEKVVIQWG